MEPFTNKIAQYSRRKSLELHEIPTSISDQDLGEKFLRILHLTQVSIKQEDIVQYHKPRKKSHVIVKLEEYQANKMLQSKEQNSKIKSNTLE